MRKFYPFLLFILLSSCNSADKRPLVGESEYQKKLNSQFKNAAISPLKKKDLKNFKGLDFFPIDSSFIVRAKLNRTTDSPFMPMATTDDRKPLYREFGTLDFKLQERDFRLTLYQSQEEMQDPRYKDYLFLPFTDQTSGEESYGGGRYMNLYLSKIGNSDTIELNFNNSYNPYCVYNEKYSCPLVPRKNHLDIEIRAGIKDFKKESK